MKILFIINSLSIGGAQKLIVDLAILLSNKYEVGFYTLNDSESFLKEQLVGHNIKILPSKKHLYSPLHIFNIAKLSKEYDVIHVNLFPSLYFVALAKLFILNRNCKLIYTEHSTENKRRHFFVFRLIEKWVYNRYDNIVCITDSVKINLINWIGDNNKIITINNGIDTHKYADATPINRSSLCISENSIILFMSARFSPAKDHITLVKALSRINDENVYLLFAGDGPTKSHVEQFVNQLGLSKNVYFLGTRDDIPQLIKLSDICILSSLWEGFGLVAVEYMAGGKPVIASDVDGLNEVVQGAGIMFKKGDAVDLSEKLMSLIYNRDIRTAVANKCKQRALLYDIKYMLDSYISLYKKDK